MMVGAGSGTVRLTRQSFLLSTGLADVLGRSLLRRRDERLVGRSVQPGINIGRFDRDDAALVLSIGRELRIGLMHARHQRVMVGIDGEHRIALEDFASD